MVDLGWPGFVPTVPPKKRIARTGLRTSCDLNVVLCVFFACCWWTLPQLNGLVGDTLNVTKFFSFHHCCNSQASPSGSCYLCCFCFSSSSSSSSVVVVVVVVSRCMHTSLMGVVLTSPYIPTSTLWLKE